jgi:hypothetical protein
MQQVQHDGILRCYLLDSMLGHTVGLLVFDALDHRRQAALQWPDCRDQLDGLEVDAKRQQGGCGQRGPTIRQPLNSAGEQA